MSLDRPGPSRKRALTENRRRQNREAQRRWRDKKKSGRSLTSSTPAVDTTLVSDQNELGVNGLSTPGLPGPLDYDQFDQTDQWGLPDGSSSIDPELLHLLDPSLQSNSSATPLRSSGTLPEPSIHTVSTLPSPYKNYLQIQKLNFYAARIHNALYIGAPLVLAEKNESTVSPWYWHAKFATIVSTTTTPGVSVHTITEGASTQRDASSNSFMTRPVRRRPCFELSNTVMADLAPTVLQRSHPHDMYIDLIPFPVFRDRIITLLSMDPPAFDENELKRDIQDEEGLLVWGVAQGRKDQTSTLVRDRRNWECAEWFSKKWRLLVSGSGLEEQSKWWRVMRGEDVRDEEQ